MLISNAASVQTEETSKIFFYGPQRELKSRGVTILRGGYFGADDKANHSKNKFAEYWNDLEPDKFMMDQGLYRKRRFGRFRYDSWDQSLSVIEGDHQFFQSKDVNPLNGGKCRNFAPVSEEFAADEFLARIVNRCLKIFSVKKLNHKSLTINAHLMRIVCASGVVGLPTPEGIHRDGHCFVSQHIINRHNVYGGVSGIYDSNDEAILHYQLSHFMDSILVDDRIVKHDVSPIFSADKTNEGYRDMLIIDYNFT